jgi:hypothetical protein
MYSVLGGRVGNGAVKVRRAVTRLAGPAITVATILVAVALFTIGLRLMWMATHR